ncbi:lysozyme inhibitor LprI family protein [Terribacillus saccharophilus]|uniref:lysozyme inhibitor LprI family protein n=1 Tax=Terribacillus saccharophilus TaxID=361277 RepID=UPI003982209C
MKTKTMLLTTLSLLTVLTLTACNGAGEQTASDKKEAEPNNVSAQDESNKPGETAAKAEDNSQGKDTVAQSSDNEQKSAADAEDSVAKNSEEAKKSDVDGEKDSAVNYSEGKEAAPKTENIQISNGDEAVQFLKEHVTQGKFEEISFGTDGKLQSDDTGSYYTVQLVDIALRESGKTGNLGYYQVYQNGTYAEAHSAFDKDNTYIAGKEEYLKKLNGMDKADRNTEVKSKTNELIEQEDEKYRKWDEELNSIYVALQEQLPADEMDELREEQRTWIADRDKIAEEASLEYEGATAKPFVAITVKVDMTKERCYTLVATYME